MGNTEGLTGKVTLGYWGVQGTGQCIRYLLAILGADWQDKVYMDPTEWFGKDKQGLGLKFPNLPYLICGDVKLTESLGILKYVAEKSGRQDLLGKTAEDYAMVECVLGVCNDIWSAIMPPVKSDNYKTELAAAYETVKDKLACLERNVVGPTVLSYLTVADLKLCTVLAVALRLFKDNADKYPKLKALQDYVERLPQIKMYREKGGITRLLPPTAKVTID